MMSGKSLGIGSIVIIFIAFVVALELLPSIVDSAAVVYESPNLTYFGLAQTGITILMLAIPLGLGFMALRKFGVLGNSNN